MVTTNVQLTKPLGEGAMGCVWIAEHLTLRTQVAVKFISNSLAQDNPEILARFEQEASVAAQIKCPHVVQTFDQGTMKDGTPYIVMELLEGETMGERLARTGRLSIRQTGQVVAQVARVLRKAHALGIVHRDIKPDNIFLTSTEDGLFCKVLDFGIAKQTQLPKMGGLTNPGVMIGTPEFMSPEQVLSAKDVDSRADLWALAVTAYYSLTGELPFQAEALGALCLALLNAKFAPATEVFPELPSELDPWFAKALHKDANKRFTDAREMALAFIQHVPQHGDDIEMALVSSSQGFAEPTDARLGTHVGMGPQAECDISDKLADLAEMHWDDENARDAHEESQSGRAGSPTLTGASSSLPRITLPSEKPHLRTTRWVVGIAALALTGATLFFLSTTSTSPSSEDTTKAAPAAGLAADTANTEAEKEEPAGKKQPAASETPQAPKEDAVAASRTETEKEKEGAQATPTASASAPDTPAPKGSAATTVAPSPPIARPPHTPRVPKTSEIQRHDHGF